MKTLHETIKEPQAIFCVDQFLALPKGAGQVEIRAAGWHFFRDGQAQAICLLADGAATELVACEVARPDVAAAFPNVQPISGCGFQLAGRVQLKEDAEIKLVASGTDGAESLLFSVRLDDPAFADACRQAAMDEEVLARESQRFYLDNRDMKRRADEQLKADDHYLKKRFGRRRYAEIVAQRFCHRDPVYAEHFLAHRADSATLAFQRETVFAMMPKISVIVPVYRTPPAYLCAMIDSLIAQSYQNWELCIADGSCGDVEVERILAEYHARDARVRYELLNENSGISGNTNAALALATGEYISLLDHDDLLAADALYEVVRAINDHEDADFIYTDEDKFAYHEDDHFEPAFKPDYNPDLLRATNYICHLTTVRTEIAKGIGGFRREFDGSQDYDFVLRCIEKARAVYHVPKVLYYWRCHENSTAQNQDSKGYAFDAGRRALQSHLDRCAKGAVAEDLPRVRGYYRVKYPAGDTNKLCVLQSAGGEDRENLSIWNRMAREADSAYLLFLDEDASFLTASWKETLLSEIQREEIAAVGCKICDGAHRILHAGMILGMNGGAAPAFFGEPDATIGYAARGIMQQNYSAVAACGLVVRREDFIAVGGFDEALSPFAAAIDLCLKLQKTGGRILYDPNVEIMMTGDQHLADRGAVKLTEAELQILIERHGKGAFMADPCYNINLRLELPGWQINTDTSK